MAFNDDLMIGLVCLFVCVCVYLRLCVCVCVYLCQTACMSACLSVCQPAVWSVCLSATLTKISTSVKCINSSTEPRQDEALWLPLVTFCGTVPSFSLTVVVGGRFHSPATKLSVVVRT